MYVHKQAIAVSYHFSTTHNNILRLIPKLALLSVTRSCGIHKC